MGRFPSAMTGACMFCDDGPMQLHVAVEDMHGEVTDMKPICWPCWRSLDALC